MNQNLNHCYLHIPYHLIFLIYPEKNVVNHLIIQKNFPGKRRRMESCSDHDYPGHFSSVIRYPLIPDRCNRKLPYEYYHYKKTVKSEYPWKIPLEKPHKIYKQKNVYSMFIPNYKKSDCGCGK